MKKTYSIAKLVALLSIVQAAMCTTKSGIAPDARDFFAKSIKGNLTKITWDHAVNSKEKLRAALATDKVMMLEADVVMGSLNDTNIGNLTDNVPIMAHPPDDVSDLSLEEFLESVLADGKRGIKLDFKTIAAFTGSRAILEKHRANMSFPVWLNADILSGPVNATAADGKPVDPSGFLAGASSVLPESTLSIGWTTRYGAKYNITKGAYTEEHVRKMIEAVGQSKTKQPITYPIRAGLAANDNGVLAGLLKDTSAHKPTLTIWSSPNDTVDDVALSKFIKQIGIDKVYVDVPEALFSKLRLSGAPSLATSSIMVVGSLIASLAVIKLV